MNIKFCKDYLITDHCFPLRIYPVKSNDSTVIPYPSSSFLLAGWGIVVWVVLVVELSSVTLTKMNGQNEMLLYSFCLLNTPEDSILVIGYYNIITAAFN